MKVLGIETSCDETAIAVIEADGDSFRVLSNIVSSQIAVHEKFGGVVPSLAAREHTANIGHVFDAALAQAGLTPSPLSLVPPIDLIAVTNGPGLGPALLVGLTFARTLAWRWQKPIVGVNHLDGHIHSNWLSGKFPVSRFQFPVLNLIVSGGHTELVLMHNHGDLPDGQAGYEIIGETQDDAVGEAFDKVARLLDLGYPGGPKISKIAESGNPQAYTLPRPMLGSPNYHFSYSGLKTAVLYLIRDLIHGNPSASSGLSNGLTVRQKADIAASFQEAAIDVLIQKTGRAAIDLKVKAILLSGGVSANTLLRTRLQELGKEIGMPVHIPDIAYTGDHAAMIAVAGYFSYQNGRRDSWDTLTMDANLRLGHNH